ncbi:MAG: HRDC domain-containing protein [Treponema sp.]|nr:HRDC domain-containing protein [Treponema sp.]
MNFTLIETDSALLGFREKTYRDKINKIAVDFEGESNLHAYGEKLCLIQIFDGEQYYIIDPLKISDREIKNFLEDKTTIKIMYGAESDATLVYSQYGVQVRNVFDLKIVVDTLNIEHKGLDAVLKYFFDVDIKDKKKYQRYNWLIRPIHKDALFYALNDVCHLLKLNERLMKEIRAKDKYDDLIYTLVTRNYNPAKNRTPGIFKKNEYKRLNNSQKELFKELYDIRESYAKEYNLPPFQVFDNNSLFDLATGKKMPATIKVCVKLSRKSQHEMREKISSVLGL